MFCQGPPWLSAFAVNQFTLILNCVFYPFLKSNLVWLPEKLSHIFTAIVLKWKVLQNSTKQREILTLLNFLFHLNIFWFYMYTFDIELLLWNAWLQTVSSFWLYLDSDLPSSVGHMVTPDPHGTDPSSRTHGDPWPPWLWTWDLPSGSLPFKLT